MPKQEDKKGSFADCNVAANLLSTSDIAMTKQKLKKLPLRLIIIYILASTFWIFFSDKFLGLIIDDTKMLINLAIFKGWLYVMLTAGLLYFLIHRYVATIQELLTKLAATSQDMEEMENKLAITAEELRDKEKKIITSEERYRLIAEGTNDGIWDLDLLTNEMYLSDKWKVILGLESNILENYSEFWKNLIHPEDINMVKEKLYNHLQKQTPYYACEYRLRVTGEEYKWVLVRGKAIFDEQGKPKRMAGSLTDITEQKKNEEMLYHMAYYDQLTGLPNRFYLLAQLGSEIKNKNKTGQKGALLLLRLDNIRLINDSLGHDYGDLLLNKIAQKLRTILPEEIIVARFGGNEFCILLPEIRDTGEINLITEQILQLSDQPWTLEEKEYFVGGNIGITIFPDEGKDVKKLLKNADIAMHQAKKLGKKSYQFYTKSMNKKFLKRINMENDLRRAIENEEFVIYYQPIINLKNGAIVGMEALIRWLHPSKGFISPGQFIPLAEETELITLIDEWMLRTVCWQNKIWQEKGYQPINISINISALQFQDKNLIKKINKILAETGLEPQYLTLEITERIAMQDLNSTIKIINKLQELGLKISLDDFGTGYSSLNYLKQMPINTLKIDKSFIYDLSQDINAKAVAETIIVLAHKMQLSIIAEGVETQEHLEFLQKHKCDKAQGFLFSKPLPTEKVQNMLAKNTIFKV